MNGALLEMCAVGISAIQRLTGGSLILAWCLSGHSSENTPSIFDVARLGLPLCYVSCHEAPWLSLNSRVLPDR